MKDRGFTLIELLVVISIIGLLSTIVLSALNEAREKARWAAFDQELNEIIKAIQIHYNNTGEWLNNMPTASFSVPINTILNELEQKDYYPKTTFTDPDGGTMFIYPGPMIEGATQSMSCGSVQPDVYYTIFGNNANYTNSKILKEVYVDGSLFSSGDLRCVNIK